STAILAERVGTQGKVTGIDLSSGMIEQAKNRMQHHGFANIEFRVGDVLEVLSKIPPNSIDVAVLTWLIGYVGCRDIFPLLKRILRPEGEVGFVAHLDRSPRVPIEIFEEITREEPQSLEKAVKLQFPQDADETERDLQASGFTLEWLHQSTFNFVCHRGQEVFDHVMKSGAGTTFYYALKSSARERLTQEFIRRIDTKYQESPEITIVHEYVAGIGTS
ncbi:MAG TPA: methyltransferase domain-containing protein, partial [bacterium]|nr:methyltransferase domain-containing protein [bacterium]